MSIPNWSLDRDEREIVDRISIRAAKMVPKRERVSPMDISMDIIACHNHACKLDLAKLESFDDANFGHDVFGIRRHLNRNSVELENHFLPRCAVPS